MAFCANFGAQLFAHKNILKQRTQATLYVNLFYKMLNTAVGKSVFTHDEMDE